ncbi:MAG: endonuclease/exonuclease/phosphatase family protein [Chloroflexi bacterium]|nr:endonuclease/exonuclease/phosphatase family protein [Chloroflexota bacterium]
MRLLTYNLYFGGADRAEQILAVLTHANADVIALTEADDRAVVEMLAARLGMVHQWARGSGDRHIATLSRFPIVDWHIYNRPPLSQAALETTLEIRPSPIGSEVGGVGVTIYNVHLLPYLFLPFELRRWQAVGCLLQIIRQQPSGPHLLVGDFNAIAPGDRVLQHLHPPRMRRQQALQFNIIFRLALRRLLSAGYTDCFRALHPADDGFTWMPPRPSTRYDYILADPTLARALTACRVVDDLPAIATASDHLPLMADFEF